LYLPPLITLAFKIEVGTLTHIVKDFQCGLLKPQRVLRKLMKIQIFKSLHEIPPSLWERLTPADFPFASYQFLSALEDSNCLGSRTGWTALYLTAWEGEDLLGAFPLFAKSNSYGEYIFDFNWAQAHEGLRIPYYPKLLAAIPFTPATGPKILLKAHITSTEKEHVSQELLKASCQLSEDLQMSSLHALFITAEEIPIFQKADFFIRHSFQFHWKNKGYLNFQGFLASLRSKRRKEILRERAQVSQSGVKIRRLTGSDLTAEHAQTMYRFYSDTIQKMGGFSYLTLKFFESVFSNMRDQILLVLATDSEGRAVAGALNFFGASTLFGRYWGCLEDYKSLHFEVCYYQGIEFALERGFQLFEAGAQGEHKFQRGFLPSLTYSAHRIKDIKLDQAIQSFVEHEKKDLKHLINDYLSHSPFSRA
jgi:predicted N-acyltransferase